MAEGEIKGERKKKLYITAPQYIKKSEIFYCYFKN